MDESGDYEWPSKYATAGRKHLEALGVISLNFNLYEYSLVIMLEERLDKKVAGFLSGALNNQERSTLIRLLIQDDPEVGEEVNYLLQHFATCSENRHNLLHSRLITPLPDVLTLEKFARGDADKLLEFQLKIGDLRRAADEMYAGFQFVLELWNYLRLRGQYYGKVAVAQSDERISPPDPSEHPTLPKRPRGPYKINPSQSVEGVRGD